MLSKGIFFCSTEPVHLPPYRTCPSSCSSVRGSFLRQGTLTKPVKKSRIHLYLQNASHVRHSFGRPLTLFVSVGYGYTFVTCPQLDRLQSGYCPPSTLSSSLFLLCSKNYETVSVCSGLLFNPFPPPHHEFSSSVSLSETPSQSYPPHRHLQEPFFQIFPMIHIF
jgi:hypothetical protein